MASCGARFSLVVLPDSPDLIPARLQRIAVALRAAPVRRAAGVAQDAARLAPRWVAAQAADVVRGDEDVVDAANRRVGAGLGRVGREESACRQRRIRDRRVLSEKDGEQRVGMGGAGSVPCRVQLALGPRSAGLRYMSSEPPAAQTGWVLSHASRLSATYHRPSASTQGRTGSSASKV